MTIVAKGGTEPPRELWADGVHGEAFAELYRRWYPALVNLCRRNLGRHEDAEAVAQEAFLRAWVSHDRFTAARPFWPWVSTIARRLCIDQRRRSGREQYVFTLDVTTTGQVEGLPDECVEIAEDHRSARLALEALKPSEQRVIALRDLHGWSYDEIARFEGVTIEAIRGSLKRARAALRRSYERVVTGVPASAAVAGKWRRSRPRLVRLAAGRRTTTLGSAMPAGDAVLGALAAALVLAAPVVVVQPRVPTVSAPSTDAAAAGATWTAAPDHRPAQASSSDATLGGSDPTPLETTGWDLRPSLSLLPSDGATAPEHVAFTWITVSPSYERDGTVFASGTVAQQCPYGPCAVLFRSTDRGASWRRLPAVGFTGGEVLLPPDFPGDSRMFVAGTATLLVSEDEGDTFVAAAPVGGPAAVSPTFAEDHRVLLGQAPGWEYRDDVEAMQPSGIVALSTSLFTTPAFSPTYAADRTVFIGGASADGRGAQQSAVFRCTSSVCEGPAILAGSIGPPALAVSSDGVLVAWRGSLVYRSVDGGARFSPVVLPVDGTVQDVAFDGESAFLVAVRRLDGAGSTGGVLRSSDGGRTWEHLGAGTRLTQGVVALAVTTDDRIVAAVSAAAGGGLLCSSDGGATWKARCE